MNVLPKPFLTLLACVATAALTGCDRTTRITTRGAGHDIVADLAGIHSIDTANGRAVISSEFGKVTVERARIQIGHAPWAQIPEGARVLVRIVRHKTKVQAKAVTIEQSSR